MGRHMIRLKIPEDLTFGDLGLSRDPDGSVSFNWAAIERLCAASGLPADQLRDWSEDDISSVIVAWYRVHRQNGGTPDPVAEDIIAEVVAEDRAGQNFSYQPGRA